MSAQHRVFNNEWLTHSVALFSKVKERMRCHHFRPAMGQVDLAKLLWLN
jgi:hypothetical protein